MGLNVGEKEKKGLRLVRVNITDRGVRLGIDSITWQFDRLIVIVIHYQIVGTGRELEQIGSEPVVVTTPGLLWHGIFGSQVPLTDVTRGITRFAKVVCQGLGINRQAFAVLPDEWYWQW